MLTLKGVDPVGLPAEDVDAMVWSLVKMGQAIPYQDWCAGMTRAEIEADEARGDEARGDDIDPLAAFL